LREIEQADPTPRRQGSDTTLERLRGLILSGEIPPGSVVSQLKLARRLGVSTTPLREAMRQLQAEGLLEAELNRRPRVPALDVDDLHAIYATRIMLESLAIVMTAAEATDEELGDIAYSLRLMREAAASSDLEAWEVAHTRFHRDLMVGATPAMAATMANFFDRAERYRRLSVLSDQPRGWTVADMEHERILDACLARDGYAAARELGEHLARTAIGLSAAFAPEVDPLPVRVAVSMVIAAESPTKPARAMRRVRG
jgi:DNA-binding GntR family transcriptional regulator